MTAGACKHAKTCAIGGAHEHVYKGVRSRAVYKFSCASCNASYIGEN